MDFITIDFETATSQRDSPCEIALTFVKDNIIVETKTWLIKPKYKQFDHFNILINSIRPEDVANEPEFNILWTEIRSLIENQFLIAHNAAFDISVLRSTLKAYQLAFPVLNYSCSYIFCKKVWQGLSSYDLKSLCKLNSIDLSHHKAGADSRATAELVLKAFELSEVLCKEEFMEKLKITVGQLYEGGFSPCETKRSSKERDLTKIIGDPLKHKAESLFYGRSVVFTGTLLSMVRAEAQQAIADIGGIISNNVYKDTDYLIVGQQDYRIVGEDGMSTKQEKAVKLIDKGATLEIISENDFIRNL